MQYDRNRYSVPASFANRPVSLRAYAERIVIVAEGRQVAEHARVMARDHSRPGKTVYDWRHYLSVLQRKPGALRNGAPFAQMPDSLRTLQAILGRREGGDREMVDILSLTLHHDEQSVLAAVELALEAGAPSKAHVTNLLSRLTEPVPPGPVETPSGLRLSVEPAANVDRYDDLRGYRHGS